VKYKATQGIEVRQKQRGKDQGLCETEHGEVPVNRPVSWKR